MNPWGRAGERKHGAVGPFLLVLVLACVTTAKAQPNDDSATVLDTQSSDELRLNETPAGVSSEPQGPSANTPATDESFHGESEPYPEEDYATGSDSSEAEDERDEPRDEPPQRPRYLLERVDVRGDHRSTDAGVIERYVPFSHGDVLDPEDTELEALEWRLRGTGWFSEVDIHLERGSRRGWVVLVVEVAERNTIVLEGLTLGISEGLNNTLDPDADIIFYVGATVAETNLFGTGARLALSGLVSTRARGFRLDYANPRLFPGSFSLRASIFYNNAREYFGNAPLVDVRCPEEVPECEPQNAVVFYKRGGLSVGTGTDVGSLARLTLDWQGEMVSVESLPDAASEDRGGEVRPIDFSIRDDISFVSALRLNLTLDHRDDPAIPLRGTYLNLGVQLSQGVIGSDYNFLRMNFLVRHWIPLWRRHTLRLGLFVGAIFGDAPFFLQFHVSDFSDLIPGRYLEMQLDRRLAPNFFNTSIGVMRQQNLAGRVDIQYDAPVYRGDGAVRSVSLYLNLGLIALGDSRDLRQGFPGYEGIARAPFDLTMDLGLRLDASFGVLQIGFSNILGFVDL